MERFLYDKMYNNEDQHWWFVSRRVIIKKILDNFINNSRSGNILEIGCGSGGNLELLSKYGNIYAIEHDDKARKMANRRNLTKVKNGHLPGDIPFTNSFELICILDVLEHIDDDLSALNSITKSLNFNGRVLITVPAYDFLWSHHDIVNHHKRRYSRNQLIEVVNNAGLNIIYSSYFNTVLFPLVFITRLFNNLFKKKQGSDIKTPPLIINSILTNIFSSERFLIPYFCLPFGVSILLLAEKRKKNPG